MLKQKGYEVHTVYLMCWQEPGCRAEEDRNDAMKVALQLDLPFQVLDFRAEYKARVMEYFFNEYKEGRTPNPDILCNLEIKFGLFYEWALRQRYEYVATGHYAKIMKQEVRSMKHGEDRHQKMQKTHTPFYMLLTPKDIHKDQTYFLYRLKQEQLSHILFPLGDYLKSEVREIAKSHNLVVAQKKDSMGICFVGDVNVAKMLEERYGKKLGEVQLTDGTAVGEHDGHWFFTVGTRGRWQRKTPISNSKFQNNNMPKLYVTAIKKDENVIVVGEREEVMKAAFTLTDVHWIDGVPQKHDNLFLKIRNTGDFIACNTLPSKDTMSVLLKTPEFGVAPGQSTVFYQQMDNHTGYKVLGGGVIV